MYKTVGIDLNYITLAEMPNFKYLKINRENKPSRDVITREEFTAVQSGSSITIAMKDETGKSKSNVGSMVRLPCIITWVVVQKKCW